MYYFFYNFGDYWKKEDWPKIVRICFSAFFIKRLELCYFTVFRKMREFDTYSILTTVTVIELGSPVSESSNWISKFYDPTDSEHKFYKTRMENWLSIGFELGFT